MRRSYKYVIIPYLLKWVLSALFLTCRVRVHNSAEYDQMLKSGEPFVLCLWHDCSTAAGLVMRKSAVTVMVSDSRDGEYVARFSQLLGINTIRGSTSKGAGKAVKAGLKLLRNKKPLAITPDGPRGPRYKMQAGALKFAASVRAPLIPMHIKATREWELNSWDRQCFPKPFSTIHVRYAKSIVINKELLESDTEETVRSVEEAMMNNLANVLNDCSES